MSIEKRRHIRFSLDLPAYFFKNDGEIVDLLIRQISIGGCLTDWTDEIFTGEDFRLELELPNKNRLPLNCKALYKFEGRGIGAKFLNITQFEQELIKQSISHALEMDGLPLLVDPFAVPPTYVANPPAPDQSNLSQRRRDDEIAEEILSAERFSSN